MAKPGKTDRNSPLFRCVGVRSMGSGGKGGFGYVELMEQSGAMLTLAFPPQGAPELANRVLSAADLAERELAGIRPAVADGTIAPPAPLVTDQQFTISDDGDTILLTIVTGAVPLAFRLSKSRSEKLRAMLEGAERELGRPAAIAAPAAANG